MLQPVYVFLSAGVNLSLGIRQKDVKLGIFRDAYPTGTDSLDHKKNMTCPAKLCKYVIMYPCFATLGPFSHLWALKLQEPTSLKGPELDFWSHISKQYVCLEDYFCQARLLQYHVSLYLLIVTCLQNKLFRL